jgi:hypothetical protein
VLLRGLRLLYVTAVEAMMPRGVRLRLTQFGFEFGVWVGYNEELTSAFTRREKGRLLNNETNAIQGGFTHYCPTTVG